MREWNCEEKQQQLSYELWRDASEKDESSSSWSRYGKEPFFFFNGYMSVRWKSQEIGSKKPYIPSLFFFFSLREKVYKYNFFFFFQFWPAHIHNGKLWQKSLLEDRHLYVVIGWKEKKKCRRVNYHKFYAIKWNAEMTTSHFVLKNIF